MENELKVTSRGSYRNGRQTREQIIAEATAAFADRGFHGTSLRQIAAAVGISAAGILRHFESKEELLNAVMESWAKQTADLQDVEVPVDPNEPPHTRGLKQWTTQHAVMTYHTKHPGLLELFITLAAESTSEEHPARAFMAPRYQQAVTMFQNSLLHAAENQQIEAITPEDALHEARALVAFMDGIEIQWFLNPELDLVAEFDHYLANTLNRLGAK